MNKFKGFYDYKRDGITQSLLHTWMSCRKKAEWYLSGYSTSYVSPALTYGTIIHGVLERVYDLIRLKKLTQCPKPSLIKRLTKEVELIWRKENASPSKQMIENLEMSLLIAEETLPLYFEYWWKEDFKQIKWRSLEQSFKIPLSLPDGRKTFIRGKKDGVFGREAIRLFETKTKSMVNLNELMDCLWFEFQVNLYLWAIKKTYKQTPVGVTYNIIRKTSIKPKVSEPMLVYAKRVAADIKKRPDFYFIRLEISVTKMDMINFEKELMGLLKEFIDWCEGKAPTYKNTGHCVDKYGRCPYLGLCSRNDFKLYIKRKTVFKELEDL